MMRTRCEPLDQSQSVSRVALVLGVDQARRGSGIADRVTGDQWKGSELYGGKTHVRRTVLHAVEQPDLGHVFVTLREPLEAIQECHRQEPVKVRRAHVQD